MSVTRIFVTTSKSDADQTAGFWTSHPDGYTVRGFGPTAKISVEKANPNDQLWKIDETGPWYGVLVTKADPAPGATADDGNGD